MYGLIHAALRDLILEDHGAETWNQVVLQSGVPSNSFLTMRSYSDETTMALVDAASQVLMLPTNDCLQVFGHYLGCQVCAEGVRRASRSYRGLPD